MLTRFVHHLDIDFELAVVCWAVSDRSCFVCAFAKVMSRVSWRFFAVICLHHDFGLAASWVIIWGWLRNLHFWQICMGVLIRWLILIGAWFLTRWILRQIMFPFSNELVCSIVVLLDERTTPPVIPFPSICVFFGQLQTVVKRLATLAPWKYLFLFRPFRTNKHWVF